MYYQPNALILHAIISVSGHVIKTHKQGQLNLCTKASTDLEFIQSTIKSFHAKTMQQ